MKSRESPGYSLREQLRAEAEAKRRAAAEQESRAQADLAFYREQLLPPMLAAAEYFEGAIADLNAIDREVTALFPIGPDASREIPFRQSDYQVFVDNAAQPTSIAVSCLCEMKLPATRHIASVVEADSFEKHLREMGIEFHRRRQEDLSTGEPEKSRFTMEGSVSAGFNLNAMPEQRAIEVLTRNLEPEPRRSHMREPPDVNEELLETLLRLLLRQTNRLLRYEVDPQTRAWLQEQTELQKRERREALETTPRGGLVHTGLNLKHRVTRAASPAVSAIGRSARSLVDRVLPRAGKAKRKDPGDS